MIWASATEIATELGVSPQAVSKAIKKFADTDALPVQRGPSGRIIAVSLAHFQNLREKFANPAKTKVRAPAAGELPSGPVLPTSESFDEARRRNEWLKHDREQLRLQEEAGALVRADRLREALAVTGREFGSVVARLQNRADDLALTVSKEGAHGLRVALRKVAFDLLTDFADHLARVAEASPTHDELLGISRAVDPANGGWPAPEFRGSEQ